jgi:hypothetical protein
MRVWAALRRIYDIGRTLTFVPMSVFKPSTLGLLKTDN